MSVHLVVYSNGEPYDTTKKLTIESVHKYTNKRVIIHEYSLDTIRTKEWFEALKNLPNIHKHGRRDGYYNCWKAFITKDVFDDAMEEGDILYYVDSSRYFQTGFTENIDVLCDIASQKLCIAGSIGTNVRNDSYGCCDDVTVWNHIVSDGDKHLSKPHVLNSWFLFKKCDSNREFIHDWVHYSVLLAADGAPLVTCHHTGDQSIFNILVIKHKKLVFHHPNVDHDTNKNKNVVLGIVNNTASSNEYFCFLA